MFNWIIGIYLRLSSDDGDKFESNSITNQKNMIKMFLEKYKNIKIFKIYIDDGYTGTDFNRPGFQDMMNDIRNGRINAIVVKDLSRIGRNYINVGEFIENVIKRYNLRFISINDDIDSYLKPESMDSLEVSFKNLMNENYSKDTSKKLRTSLKISKKKGNFIGKIAPYGYVKDLKNYHKFKVDHEAANVIKKIFNMALKGKTRQEIVDELNDLHIITPSQYMKNKYNEDFAIVSKKWTLKILDYIIKNETYTGMLVQNKKTRINHKTHSIVRVAEEEWIKFEEHHEAIISEKIFNQVNNMLYNRNSKLSSDGTYKKYSGYLKCADCGTSLYRNTRPNSNNICYYCGLYRNKKGCTKHYITEKELDELVLGTLNAQIEMLCNFEDIITENFSNSKADYELELKKIRITEIHKKIEKYNKLLSDLISDYKEDIISQEDFESYNKDYLYELNKLKIEKENLEKKNISKNNIDWINAIKKLGHVDEIKRNILNDFIDNIFITEEKNIRIEFKFKNQFEELADFLRSQNYLF